MGASGGVAGLYRECDDCRHRDERIRLLLSEVMRLRTEADEKELLKNELAKLGAGMLSEVAKAIAQAVAQGALEPLVTAAGEVFTPEEVQDALLRRQVRKLEAELLRHRTEENKAACALERIASRLEPHLDRIHELVWVDDGLIDGPTLVSDHDATEIASCVASIRHALREETS